MEFKKFTAGSYSYGMDYCGELVQYENGVTNVNFDDPEFWRQWRDITAPNHEFLRRVVYNLAICHTIIVDEKDGELNYNASSPDELALTNAARHFGVVFKERDENGNIVIYDKILDETIVYELLNIVEFSSARKRMSVIVRGPDGQILCLTKGADSIMIPLLHPGQEKMIQDTLQHLQGFAE